MNTIIQSDEKKIIKFLKIKIEQYVTKINLGFLGRLPALE